MDGAGAQEELPEVEPPDIVSRVINEDESVLVSLREGLLQCVSWMTIQQYLSRGRLTSRVNWLSIIHILVAKLQGVVLSELTERLNTLVSALVRIKKCESVGNPLLAVEDLVHLLGKIKRFPELKDDAQRVQDVIVEAQCQIVLCHFGYGEDRQATEAWDLHFCKIHESSTNRHWKIADRLKRVIPTNQLMDATSANFSVEDFMAAHSMENFCEQAWTLADYVVNKRLQEPKMFKEWKNGENLLNVLSEDLNRPSEQHECLTISEPPTFEQEQQPTANEVTSSMKVREEPHSDDSDEEGVEVDGVRKPQLQDASKDPGPSKQVHVEEGDSDEGEKVPWSDDSSFVQTPPSRLPERLPPASVPSRDSLLTSKPATKPKRKKAKSYRTRTFWTMEEERYICQGVKRFGVGKWKEIRDAYSFSSCRTSQDIKDKWRNMNK